MIQSPVKGEYGRAAKVGVVWILLGRSLYEFVQIPASMVVARILTPQEFGAVAAANFFVQIAQRLTNFGFNSALVQRKEITAVDTSSVFVVNVTVGFVTWAIVAASAPWFGSVFRSEAVAQILPVAAASFAISSIGSVPATLLGRGLRFRQNALIDVAYAWTLAGLSVVMALRGWGVWSLVWSQIVASVLQTACRLVVSGWRPSLRFSWASLKEMLSFGIGLHVQRLLDSAALNVDNLVIGRALGLSSLGFYDKAFTMMNRAVILLSSAAPAISFRIFAIIHGDPDRFRVAYRKVLLATTFSAYPTIGLLIASAPDLFWLLFGPQWGAAVLPFQLLSVGGMFKTLNALQSSAAQSTGQVWGEVRRQILYLTLIVTGVAVGSRWGLPGASAGVLVATLTMSCAMGTFLRRVTALTWADLVRPQVPAVTCTVCSVALVSLLRYMMGDDMSFLAVVRRGISAAVLHVAFCLLFLRYGGSADLRLVVGEVVEDLVPWLAPWMGWVGLSTERLRDPAN